MGMFAGTPFDRPPHCERCDRPETECTCPPEPVKRIPPGSLTLTISKEKRKKGKLVSVVSGLADEPEVNRELLTDLKTHCGAGGKMEGAELEIQGDHVARLQTLLQAKGYRVRT
ncbi:MAG: translation initiation factor [Planctomycetaceae bacterium]|nr:translation initiation factor [Planctomycetaceae bacterium]